MRQVWFSCHDCKTTHPQTALGCGLYVCPYCSSTSVQVIARSDVATRLKDGALLPVELKATARARTSMIDTSVQANIHLTGERPALSLPIKPSE